MSSSRTAFRKTVDRTLPKGRGAAGTTKRGRFLDARTGARQQRMELTPAHLEVVRFLQAYAAEHRSVPDARELASAMDQHFEHKGGSRYLKRLFPRDPVTQASEIAGLALPGARAED